jgi:hypothetical protein
MSQRSGGEGIAARVAALRDEFDQGFALPERPPPVQLESVLALRFDTAPYAVALAEVAEIGRAPRTSRGRLHLR